MEKQEFVIMVGWWMPTIDYVEGGPRSATYSVIDINDEFGMQIAMNTVNKFIERWPVSEYELVAREEFIAHPGKYLGEMREKIKEAYKEWYTPQKWEEYLKGRFYEFPKRIYANTPGGNPPVPEPPDIWD